MASDSELLGESEQELQILRLNRNVKGPEGGQDSKGTWECVGVSVDQTVSRSLMDKCM